MTILDWINGLFCGNSQIQIDNYKKQVSDLTAKNSVLQKSYDYLQQKDAAQIILLQEQVAKSKSEKQLFWENKYQQKQIFYTGRQNFKTKKMVNVDVRMLITPNDYMVYNVLKENNLFIADSGNINESVVKIYNWIEANWYKYVTDQDNYGIPEQWEFPFEVLTAPPKSGFDCDSWANLQASFYIAAGVPDWRVRVVCGNCSWGGHSTVYVLDDSVNVAGSNGKWRHLNSTYGNKFVGKNNLEQFPTTDDAYSASDDMGIQIVWLSFNNRLAWQEFKTNADKKNYQELRLFKEIL